MHGHLTPAASLPADGTAGTLVGRAWRPGRVPGPSPVAIREDGIYDLGRSAPTLSEHVEWAIRRAIQADPSRRFATCPEFIAALTEEELGTDSKLRIASPNAGGNRRAAERRAARRYECALPTSCFINLSVHEEATGCESSWDARVYSLSVNGIGFYLPRRFEPGSVLNLVLTSRSGKVTASRHMRVVRVTAADGAGWLLAGSFTDNLSKEELRNLL